MMDYQLFNWNIGTKIVILVIFSLNFPINIKNLMRKRTSNIVIAKGNFVFKVIDKLYSNRLFLIIYLIILLLVT